MKIGFLKPGELIIPLTVLAFTSPGISYFNSIFNTTTRWGVLLLLSFCMLRRQRDILAVLRRPLFWTVVVYAIWCLMTVIWSEVPRISFAKSIVFMWVTGTLLVSGFSWVARHEWTKTCDFLWLFAVCALLASFGSTSDQNLGVSLYQGLTGNPNYLGVILAIACPWLLWRIYLNRQQNRRNYIWYISLLVFDLYYLFQSHSRASILIVVSVLLGLLMGLGKFRKYLAHILILFALLGVAYQFSPMLKNSITEYIYKSDLEHIESGMGVLYTREQVWEESYAKAKMGGLLGGGNGINIGEAFHGKIGFTISSGSYGREQGNSQFAIMEQMGLIGLGFYMMLIVGIVWVFVSGLRSAKFEMDRVAIGLLGGAVFGLLVQSIFEAWWVAPGAPESAMFWVLVGALLGVARRARLSAHHYRLAREIIIHIKDKP